MSTRDHAPGYMPNPDYTQEDWNDVSDNPELTEKDFARAKPLRDTAPALALALRSRRDQQTVVADEQVTPRLDTRVLDHFRATDEGWQDRINEVLLKMTGY